MTTPCCDKCLKCPDYTKHNFCHNPTCECHGVKEDHPNDGGWENDAFHRLKDLDYDTRLSVISWFKNAFLHRDSLRREVVAMLPDSESFLCLGKDACDKCGGELGRIKRRTARNTVEKLIRLIDQK